ncbi:MAG: hypothetical protein CM15mP22_7030 [Gammaproteobacteria bacterium]|nr:MAG: hypothetical protein CM15mP22_7030 [Gammaproteobacteria bacterium]
MTRSFGQNGKNAIRLVKVVPKITNEIFELLFKYKAKGFLIQLNLKTLFKSNQSI